METASGARDRCHPSRRVYRGQRPLLQNARLFGYPRAAFEPPREATTMTEESAAPAPAEAPPDRLAINPSSKFYDEALLARGVGIRFNGQEKNNVEEYCVSEGWI